MNIIQLGAISRGGKDWKFPKQLWSVHSECSCFLFSTSLLPPRTLSSPPLAWDGCFWWGRPLDKLIHHTGSTFGGKSSSSSFPTWPFDKNDSRFWQPVTLLTVSHVSHFGSASLFCLIWSLVQFTALPFVPKVKSQTWTRIVIEIHNCSCISFQTITICITN